jgi:hypothetical protein
MNNFRARHNMSPPNGAPMAIPMQQGVSLPGQNPTAGISIQQALTNMNPVVAQPPNNGLLPGQQLSLQQQRQRLQQQQGQRHLNANVEMTKEQMEDMDRVPFPPQILNSTNSTIPKHIKMWGQLKQFVAKNPQILGTNVDLQKLQHLQRFHLQRLWPDDRSPIVVWTRPAQWACPLSQRLPGI